MKLRHAAVLAFVLAFGCLRSGCSRHPPSSIWHITTVTGPKTAAGNYDSLDFLWYPAGVIDNTVTAHANYDRFLNSLCDTNGANCGAASPPTIQGWADIIANTSLPALPSGSSVINVGYMDNGAGDPTTLYMTVDFMCNGSFSQCRPPTGYQSLAAYVQAQVLAATNSVGFSVQSAMQSFGLSTALNMNQVTGPPDALTQPGPLPTQPTIRYYSGALNN